MALSACARAALVAPAVRLPLQAAAVVVVVVVVAGLLLLLPLLEPPPPISPAVPARLLPVGG